MNMQFINKLKDGDKLNSVYHVKTKSQAIAKTGKEYFNVQLADKTGMIDAKIWDTSAIGIEEFKAGDFVYVEGDVISYNNQLQAKVARLRIADKDEYNADDYFATSKYNKNDMIKALDTYISEVKNENYKRLLNAFFVAEISVKVSCSILNT